MEPKIGAQTIVWGESIRENMEHIVETLARLGYTGVETGMRHFHADRASFYRSLYEKQSMIPLGLHSGGQFWEPDQAAQERERISNAVSFAADVGFRYVVVSGNSKESVETMKSAAETYNRIAEQCRDAGLLFAYHNHNWELSHDGAILETLVRNTDPKLVKLVLDVAWIHVAGMDVRALARRYAERVAYLHVKDVRGTTFSELGTGEVDHARTVAAAKEHGIEWLVVEQDYSTLAPEESMRVNMEYLRGMEGAG